MIELNCFVIGVMWVDGELWYGMWESDQSDLWCIDLCMGQVFEQIDMLVGVGVLGFEFDGYDWFYCGGGNSGKLCVVCCLVCMYVDGDGMVVIFDLVDG